MKIEKTPKISIGVISLVVIFAVLCLTVFALLAYLQAQNQVAIAQKVADATMDYYAADYQASTIAQEIVVATRQGQRVTALTKGENWQIVPTADGLMYSYMVVIDSNRQLNVTLLAALGQVRQVQWQVVNTANWQADDKMPIWQGTD